MNDTRFESCIKCTVCTTSCPVSRVNPRYPGPKQAGPDGERLRLKDGALYDEALKYCINCKRCEVACPSDVKIGDIIQRARAQYSQQKPTLRDAILSHTDLMGTLSTPFAPLVNAATGLKPVRRLLDATLKIDHRRTLPKYGFGTFRRAYRQQADRQAQFSEQVAFFHGCLWGGDRLCMDGSSPRKQREALRDKAWGRTSRICTAGRKMRFFYDLCDEFCTILDC